MMIDDGGGLAIWLLGEVDTPHSVLFKVNLPFYTQ